MLAVLLSVSLGAVAASRIETVQLHEVDELTVDGLLTGTRTQCYHGSAASFDMTTMSEICYDDTQMDHRCTKDKAMQQYVTHLLDNIYTMRKKVRSMPSGSQKEATQKSLTKLLLLQKQLEQSLSNDCNMFKQLWSAAKSKGARCQFGNLLMSVLSVGVDVALQVSCPGLMAFAVDPLCVSAMGLLGRGENQTLVTSFKESFKDNVWVYENYYNGASGTITLPKGATADVSLVGVIHSALQVMLCKAADLLPWIHDHISGWFDVKSCSFKGDGAIIDTLVQVGVQLVCGNIAQAVMTVWKPVIMCNFGCGSCPDWWTTEKKYTPPESPWQMDGGGVWLY